jgi:hypothetical protein
VPPGFPAAPPGFPPGPPGAVSKTRGRIPLIVGGAILAIVLVVVLVSVLQDGPDLTFDGRPLDRPESTLRTAERHLRSLVDERNGATDDDTRCYFSLREGESSDVRDVARCGPVLFVDGDPEASYLTYPLDARGGEGDRVRLVAAEEPQGQEPERLPRAEELRRPDGEVAPEGSGGLQPPPPPRADRGHVEALPAGDLEDLEEAPDDARLGALHVGYTVTALTEPTRIGHGDNARRPADGEKFVGAEIDVAPGEVSGLGAADVDVTIQVGDEDPVPAPDIMREPFASLGLVVSVPEDTERVDLIVADTGVEQRLDLLEGNVGRNNPTVLRRDNREQDLNATANLTLTASRPGYYSRSFTVTPTIDAARLFWHYPVDGGGPTTRPPGPDRAYLVPVINWAGDPELIVGPDDGLPLPHYSLRLPDGQTIPAIDIDPNTADQWFTVAFDVPADFTEGTMVIGGSSLLVDDITVDFGPNRLEAPISIPAG